MVSLIPNIDERPSEKDKETMMSTNSAIRYTCQRSYKRKIGARLGPGIEPVTRPQPVKLDGPRGDGAVIIQNHGEIGDPPLRRKSIAHICEWSACPTIPNASPLLVAFCQGSIETNQHSINAMMLDDFRWHAEDVSIIGPRESPKSSRNAVLCTHDAAETGLEGCSPR